MKNISFIQLADYVTPEISENKKTNWVNYGEDNDYFGYLIELINNSPTNAACIKSTADQIYGNGLAAVKSDRRVDAYVSLKKTFRPEDVKRVCADYKGLGMAAFELISNKKGDKINQAKHIPMNYLRSGTTNKEGEVEEWWYSTDWAKYKKAEYKPVPIPVFNPSKIEARSIIVIRPYTAGLFYYSLPDYISCTPWADVESELSNFHLSNLKNGMWPGMLVNFNNGVPTEEEQQKIENSLKRKWGKSSNAGRMVVAFNRDKDSAATLEAVQLSDAAEQFQTISSEALQKIMLGHRVTSPMLLGIKENTGFGNNAEELQSAHALYYNTVVKPMQDDILNAIDSVLLANGYALDLYFKPLTPLEFKDYDISIDSETKEKDTGVSPGVEMSEESPTDLDLVADDIILKGEKEEDLLNDYELFDVDWSDGEKSEDNIEKRLNSLLELNANQESYQDGAVFKVRYVYKKTAKSPVQDNNHRPLCSKLLNAALIYRKEDITSMSSQGGAEDKGQQYDVFLHKGGANCQHGWERRIYRKRLKKDGEPWGGGAMNGVTRARIYDAINGDANISQSADKKAHTAPRDTPTNGYKA